MLERNAGGVPREEVVAASNRERVGAITVTDRPIPVSAPHREPVSYPLWSLWLVVEILVVLFAIFFGWVLFLR